MTDRKSDPPAPSGATPPNEAPAAPASATPPGPSSPGSEQSSPSAPARPNEPPSGVFERLLSGSPPDTLVSEPPADPASRERDRVHLEAVDGQGLGSSGQPPSKDHLRIAEPGPELGPEPPTAELPEIPLPPLAPLPQPQPQQQPPSTAPKPRPSRPPLDAARLRELAAEIAFAPTAEIAAARPSIASRPTLPPEHDVPTAPLRPTDPAPQPGNIPGAAGNIPATPSSVGPRPAGASPSASASGSPNPSSRAPSTVRRSPLEGPPQRATHVPDQPLAPAPAGALAAQAQARERGASAVPRRRSGSTIQRATRDYPKFLSLLHGDVSELAPRSLMIPPARTPPPVPGTFVRSGPPVERREPTTGELPELDVMLETMAEGLLVGADGKGGSEIRVTLRDEFFRGTELRITVESGEVRAQLLPPDRDTYRLLSSELHRLRMNLEERGLRVGVLQVVEP